MKGEIWEEWALTYGRNGSSERKKKKHLFVLSHAHLTRRNVDKARNLCLLCTRSLLLRLRRELGIARSVRVRALPLAHGEPELIALEVRVGALLGLGLRGELLVDGHVVHLLEPHKVVQLDRHLNVCESALRGDLHLVDLVGAVCPRGRRADE